MSKEVFESNRPYFVMNSVNDVVITHGVQKGYWLLRQALSSLNKIQGRDTDKFPPELDDCRWWMDRLLVGEAEELCQYCANASSLAYRYLRKKRK